MQSDNLITPLLRIIHPNRRPDKRYLKRAPRRQVYVTWDPVLRQRVVVKRYVNINDALHERAVMRSYPDSRHLVRYYRFVRGQRGGRIIMEWVRGITLKELIARKGVLSTDKVRAIALDILAGLHILHSAGFVHGDMHSPNVILTDVGRARTTLIDFQHTVRLGRNGTARARRTVSVRPLKLGPECSTTTIDRAFDTYGVGFMCASMLLGREPLIPEQLLEPPVRHSKLWPIIERALQPEPSARYRTAAGMHAALTSVH